MPWVAVHKHEAVAQLTAHNGTACWAPGCAHSQGKAVVYTARVTLQGRSGLLNRLCLLAFEHLLVRDRHIGVQLLLRAASVDSMGRRSH